MSEDWRIRRDPDMSAELDPDAYAGLARRARKHRDWSRWLPRLSFVITVPIALLMLMLVSFVVGRPDQRLLDATDAWIESVFGVRTIIPDLIVVSVCVLWTLGIPAAIALLWRDAQIQEEMARMVAALECFDCGQSLVGLPVLDQDHEPRVRCPECGFCIRLRELGLTVPGSTEPPKQEGVLFAGKDGVSPDEARGG